MEKKLTMEVFKNMIEVLENQNYHTGKYTITKPIPSDFWFRTIVKKGNLSKGVKKLIIKKLKHEPTTIA